MWLFLLSFIWWMIVYMGCMYIGSVIINHNKNDPIRGLIISTEVAIVIVILNLFVVFAFF